MDSYSDGNFTVASQAGPETPSFPIPGLGALVTTVPMIQEAANWAALAIGTARSGAPTWFLVSESDPQPAGNGLVRWNRVYAQVPPTHDEWESMAYNFIGLYANPAAELQQIGNAYINPTGRYRFSLTVPCRVRNEYFRVGAGLTYTTADSIPLVTAQRYYWGTNPNATGLWTDYLADASEVGADSTPTKTAYLAMVAAGTELVAQDSTLARWMGNIYRRQTVYVKAR